MGRRAKEEGMGEKKVFDEEEIVSMIEHSHSYVP